MTDDRRQAGDGSKVFAIVRLCYEFRTVPEGAVFFLFPDGRRKTGEATYVSDCFDTTCCEIVDQNCRDL